MPTTLPEPLLIEEYNLKIDFEGIKCVNWIEIGPNGIQKYFRMTAVNLLA